MILWLVLVFSPLALLERKASEFGIVTLQQTHLADGLGWFCSIRAHEGKGKPRYSWTAQAMTLKAALYYCLREAEGNPIKPIIGTKCAPKLGGAEFDGDD